MENIAKIDKGSKNSCMSFISKHNSYTKKEWYQLLKLTKEEMRKSKKPFQQGNLIINFAFIIYLLHLLFICVLYVYTSVSHV